MGIAEKAQIWYASQHSRYGNGMTSQKSWFVSDMLCWQKNSCALSHEQYYYWQHYIATCIMQTYVSYMYIVEYIMPYKSFV